MILELKAEKKTTWLIRAATAGREKLSLQERKVQSSSGRYFLSMENEAKYFTLKY